MKAQVIRSIFILHLAFSMCASASENKEESILHFSSSMRNILSKGLGVIKSGRFSIKFDKDGVKLFSIEDCTEDYKLVDVVGYEHRDGYMRDEIIERYISYLNFSLRDPHGVQPENLIGYYICVLENGDVTTFAFTGGPNSRGGGPIYLINSKENKLLEVHYMQ